MGVDCIIANASVGALDESEAIAQNVVNGAAQINRTQVNGEDNASILVEGEQNGRASTGRFANFDGAYEIVLFEDFDEAGN